MKRALLALSLVASAYVAVWFTDRHTLLETCRVVNVPLALLTAAGFFIRINDMWARYGAGGRLLRVGLFGLLAVSAGGSAEAYVTHAALGYRSVALNFALLICGAGLILLHRDPDQF